MSRLELADKFVEIPCSAECKICEGTLDTCKLSEPEKFIEEVDSLLIPILAGVLSLLVILIVCGLVLWCKQCMKAEKASKLPKISNVQH